jgi:protein gp37
MMSVTALCDARRTWARRFDVLPNVWLGTSIESDRYAWRVKHLRKTPAAVRFVSLEPLIGDLPSLDFTDIDWAIVGGESGTHARPMLLTWVRDQRTRARA